MLKTFRTGSSKWAYKDEGYLTCNKPGIEKGFKQILPYCFPKLFHSNCFKYAIVKGSYCLPCLEHKHSCDGVLLSQLFCFGKVIMLVTLLACLCKVLESVATVFPT